MCDRTCTYPCTRKIPSESEKSPVPSSLSTVLPHMRNRNFVVATATLVTVTFCPYISALSYFFLNETFDMLQQQEALSFEYRNIESHLKFRIIKSNRLSRQERMCELTLLPLALISSGHGLLLPHPRPHLIYFTHIHIHTLFLHE